MSVTWSMIIPAHNEEALLPKCLESAAEAAAAVDAPGEVIVVDNASTDDTARIASERGARVVVEPHRQISRARNTGARQASGEFLVFLDADTFLPPTVLKQALENLSSGECAGGGSHVRFDAPLSWSLRKFLQFWTWSARRFGLAAGCFIYCTREAFDAIGGFDERVYASEEVWFSRALVKWGKRHGKPFRLIADPPVVTSGRKLEWYTALELLLRMALVAFVPFAMRSRRCCAMWYDRPA